MAKEYIERDAAKKEFSLRFGGVSHAVIANRILDEIPAADVVEVVRCRNCRNSIEQFRVEGINGIACCDPNPIYHCKQLDTEVPHDYFCGSGERRDNNE